MRPPYIRPTEAPTQLNWPELLDLAERLDTKVYRLDDHVAWSRSPSHQPPHINRRRHPQ